MSKLLTQDEFFQLLVNFSTNPHIPELMSILNEFKNIHMELDSLWKIHEQDLTAYSNDLHAANDRNFELEKTIELIYDRVTRELAEPGNETALLVEIASKIEELKSEPR